MHHEAATLHGDEAFPPAVIFEIVTSANRGIRYLQEGLGITAGPVELLPIEGAPHLLEVELGLRNVNTTRSQGSLQHGMWIVIGRGEKFRPSPLAQLAIVVGVHFGAEDVETGTTRIEQEEATLTIEILSVSAAARRIGVGTGFLGMSENVTEIKSLSGAMMSTGGLGRTDLVSLTDTNEIHLFGLIQGIRQPQIRPRPSQQQALHRTS